MTERDSYDGFDPTGPDYWYNRYQDREGWPCSTAWLNQTEKWIHASNYTGTAETAAITQHLINEVRLLREEVEQLRRTPRLRHDWNDGPPKHCWLLDGEEVVIADPDPTGIFVNARIKKAVRVEVEEIKP